MSDNLVQYRAIQALYNELVEAISPEVDILIAKCWSKEIIGKQQLNLSLEPNVDTRHKASALVSALISRLSKDITAFDKFVAILNEESSLSYIADSLLREVERLKSSHHPSGSGVSSGASPQTSYRPPNEMPKLDLAEGESGFSGEEGHDLGPIGGEIESASGSALDLTLVPESDSQSFIKSFKKIEGGDSLAESAGVVVKQDEDENLPIRSPYKDDEEDVSPIEAAGESSRYSKKQEEMVFPSGQQSKPSSTAGDKKFLNSIDTILKENEKKNTRIHDLEEKLAANNEELTIAKESEARLIKRVKELSEENQQLRYELTTKEAEQKRSKDELEKEIKSLKLKLQAKEEEVNQARAQLAEAEKQNESPNESQRKIKQLEEERKKLKSEVSKLKGDYQKLDYDYRMQILDLKEKLSEKKTEEIERREELSNIREELSKIQVELVNCKLVIANQRAELKDKDLEKSQATVAEMQKQMDLHKSSSIPKHIHEAEMAKAEARIEDLERMLSDTSINADQAQSPADEAQSPLFRNQSSLTESAGRPSPSTSDPNTDSIARQISSTESTVHFEIEQDENGDSNSKLHDSH